MSFYRQDYAEWCVQLRSTRHETAVRRLRRHLKTQALALDTARDADKQTILNTINSERELKEPPHTAFELGMRTIPGIKENVSAAPCYCHGGQPTATNGLAR